MEKLPGNWRQNENTNPAWPLSASPWKTNPNQDTSDDGSPYYIGVTVEWTPRPLFQLLAQTPLFAAGGVKQFASVMVKPVPRGGGKQAIVRYTTAYDMSSGKTWQDWNNMLEQTWNNTYADPNTSWAWTPAAWAFWRDTCKTPDGRFPTGFRGSTYADQISFERCGRWNCAAEFGGTPFTARLLDICGGGGDVSPDCNEGKFYIRWVCLYDS